MGIPIMLDVLGKRTVVVGGGPVGFRKARTLMSQGADVVCISPDFDERFSSLKDLDSGCLVLVQRHFEDIDIEGAFLVVAAADDINVNGHIKERCSEKGILCMTADKVNASDFAFMASASRDSLTIGVSTDGKSPGFSKKLVRKLMGMVSLEDIKELTEMIKKREGEGR